MTNKIVFLTSSWSVYISRAEDMFTDSVNWFMCYLTSK